MKHAEEELVGDVFFVLRSDDKEIFDDLVEYLAELEGKVGAIFTKYAAGTARSHNMHEFVELHVLKDQRVQIELFYTVQLQRIFAKARGLNV